MTAELVRLATAIPIPIDHLGPARAYCAVEPGGYRVWFGLDGGRRREYVGPTFPRPAGAIALANLLNGDPTPRSAPVIPAVPSSQDPRDEPDLEPSEAPEAASSPVGLEVAGRTCVICGGPIPIGSRSHRRTCSRACRISLSRRSDEPGEELSSPPTGALRRRPDRAIEAPPPH